MYSMYCVGFLITLSQKLTTVYLNLYLKFEITYSLWLKCLSQVRDICARTLQYQQGTEFYLVSILLIDSPRYSTSK